MGLRERVIGAVVGGINRAVTAFDTAVSGDEPKPLTPAQRAQMKRWFNETRPGLKRMGVDITWGNPHAS